MHAAEASMKALSPGPVALLAALEARAGACFGAAGGGAPSAAAAAGGCPGIWTVPAPMTLLQASTPTTP